MSTPTDHQQQPELDEEFANRYRQILQDWQAGDIKATEAEQQLLDMLKEAEDDNNRMNQGGAELSLGIIHGYLAHFTDSARHFETARQHFEAVGAQDRVVTCDLNIGETYRLQGNFTRAQLFSIALMNAAKYWATSAQWQLPLLTKDRCGSVWIATIKQKKPWKKPSGFPLNPILMKMKNEFISSVWGYSQKYIMP